ncbi:hypothetical protein [Actinoplanes solisilvae]|uniref:hypothetical protein n=1 Tax=Actinoplanes solisilvae TaxID=2486853 RepID=UPI000FD9D820|nr:hypothetical protein [Actinoplanes solisilvae]
MTTVLAACLALVISLWTASASNDRADRSRVDDLRARLRDDMSKLGELFRLVRETDLIEADDALGPAVGADSDGYRFEHGLLQQTLYNDQSAGQRRRRHRAIAAELERISQQARSSLPLGLLLDIARHYRAGDDNVGAGRSAHKAACSLASTGASIREVAAICRQGLEDLEGRGRQGEAARIRAQLLELLLAATELDWNAEREPDGTNVTERLARDAIAAADESQDTNLRVRVRYLYGKVLLYTQGLHQALGPLRESWEAAVASGDGVSQLLAGCEYGRQLPKIDVAAGIDVLLAAAQIAETDPAVRLSDDPVIIRARDMLYLQIGVNLMDAGNLGPAVVRLRDAVGNIRERGTLGLLPIGLNYLAQAELGIGQVEAGQRTLEEVVGLAAGREVGAWDAVNLAYLGWLRVVRLRDPTGLSLLNEARAATARHWQANLASLVENLYIAALLEGPREGGTLDTVEQAIDGVIGQTRRTGMLRSEVVALSLLARLKLLNGDLDAALLASDAAVAHLREAKWALAAVNAEEVLVHHAIVLAARGDIVAARNAVRRAAAEVRRKARSLSPDQQERFLREVPVNVLVAETVRNLAESNSARHAQRG